MRDDNPPEPMHSDAFAATGILIRKEPTRRPYGSRVVVEGMTAADGEENE